MDLDSLEKVAVFSAKMLVGELNHWQDSMEEDASQSQTLDNTIVGRFSSCMLPPMRANMNVQGFHSNSAGT